MWADIATGGAVLLGGGVMFRVLWSKLDTKQDTDMCGVLHADNKNNVIKIEKDRKERAVNLDIRFNKIDEALSKQTETLHSLDKSIALMTIEFKKNNGA